MSKKSKDPCKANACKIQSCLERNNYQESCCLDVLEEMRQCCLKWHTESICCSGIKLDKVYVPKQDSKQDSKTNQKDTNTELNKSDSQNYNQLYKQHILKWKLF